MRAFDMSQVPTFFFFKHTATPEIYTLSLHDALPISGAPPAVPDVAGGAAHRPLPGLPPGGRCRSEEHTSELQSHHDLVCRLLLEKKKTHKIWISLPIAEDSVRIRAKRQRRRSRSCVR